MFKTSFNGLVISVTGVYSAYNLTPKELEQLKRTFGPSKVNGSQGNYTVFKDAHRAVFLKLFVHDIWEPMAFDIRKDLLRLFKSDKIFKKDIDKISKQLKGMRIQLHVCYDHNNRCWKIVDYESFLEVVAKLIAEL